MITVITGVQWVGTLTPPRRAAIGRDTTTVRARSGAGKSTLIRAVCVGLLGCDADGGAASALCGPGSTVAVGLGGGRSARYVVPERRGKASPPPEHRVWASGEPVEPYTPPRDANLRRLVLVPTAWRRYGTGPHLRELRELLTVAVGGDLRALVIEALPEDVTLRDAEPHDAAHWATMVRDARRDADRADGALQAALASLATLDGLPPVDEPSIDAATVARNIRDEARAWVAYDAAMAARPASGPTWTADDESALADAVEAVRTAGAAVVAAREAHAAAEGAHRTPASDLATMRTRAQAAADARRRLASVPCGGGVLGDVDCGQCSLISDARVAVAQAPDPEAGKALAARLAALASDMTTAQQAVAAANEAQAAANRAVSTLHARRVSAARIQPPPAEPPWPRVLSADLAAAEEVLARVTAAADEVRRRSAIRADAEHRLGALRTTVSATAAALARAEAILTAARTSPQRAADRLRAALEPALTDAGHALSLDTGETARTPAIDVLPMGRPWATASTGERIHADAVFRAALRAAAGLGDLPVIVDEAQSCTIDLDIPGPVVLLVTAADAEWEVTS